MSALQPAPRPASTRRLSKAQLWLALIAAIVLGVLAAVVIHSMGRVQGEEFSPTHFRARTFSFYEIPLIHWQITPIDHSPSVLATATTLRQKKWITPPPHDPTLWHLVSLSRGMEESRDADAALLVEQLRFYADGDFFWRKWSQDHSDLAVVLWPEIEKLAQRELYILIPRLLEIARRADDSDQLRSEIESYLQQEYAVFLRDVRAAGRDDLAGALQVEAGGRGGRTEGGEDHAAP